jgi:hypothetical protein
LDDHPGHPLQSIRKEEKIEINKILAEVSLEKLEEIQRLILEKV